jgi:hypothetical protein
MRTAARRQRAAPPRLPVGSRPCGRMPAVAQANIREQGLAPTNTTHQDLDASLKTTKEPCGSFASCILTNHFSTEPRESERLLQPYRINHSKGFHSASPLAQGARKLLGHPRKLRSDPINLSQATMRKSVPLTIGRTCLFSRFISTNP